jgi:hypothetical protein
MTDFNAVLGDIKNMADTFHRQGGDFRKLAPKVSPPIASSGDPGLDSSIKAIADLIITFHGDIADRMDDHSAKVQYAHDSFQRHDIDVHGLFEDLMDQHKDNTLDRRVVGE